MPRPKKIDDAEVLDAALGILRRGGPAAVSFAALARESGLAGSTIVQRFGTKRDLLRATLERAWDQLDAATAEGIARATPDAAGVVDLLVGLTARYEADDFADELLVLREDLRDPVLRARGVAWLDTLAEAVDRRIGAGSPGGAGLGLLVVAHWQGLILVWGFTRRDPLPVAVRRSLDELLPRILGSGNEGEP